MTGRVSFDLEPVPPFRLDLTAWTLRRRPDSILDRGMAKPTDAFSLLMMMRRWNSVYLNLARQTRRICVFGSTFKMNDGITMPFHSCRLCSLNGVGRWMAEYFLLRGLTRTHIFPRTISLRVTTLGVGGDYLKN